MTLSLFDIFKIGIGPSSSHTVGPMVAARRFATLVAASEQVTRITGLTVTLYGSLALTGRGHGTDTAVMLGLMGHSPDAIAPDEVGPSIAAVGASHRLTLGGAREIAFDPARDIVFRFDRRLPFHSNGVTFSARAGDTTLVEETYYSIGGGFVVDQKEAGANVAAAATAAVPYPFRSGADLLAQGEASGLAMADMIMANECAARPREAVIAHIDKLWAAMEACIDRGCRETGVLPGGLSVPRRAAQLHAKLVSKAERQLVEPLAVMDWINLWAMAVNEENAAGGRVVTAPTNGAAGIVPAVLRYYHRFCNGTPEGVRTFFLVATAIASLYKLNASISGAEVGCQGEVGVACSMAAGALTAALGGSNAQIENAAEIGMEHNLGLTCDPVKGLVQIPCIERNAMGAIKAIDASRLAMLGDGSHKISLDKVIATMWQTGADMQEKYKETSLGGLAVSSVEC